MATPSSPEAPPQEAGQNPDLLAISAYSPTSTPPNPNSPTPFQSISPPRKTQPLPWSNQETVNLIQAYQEKWYSLKRGQLKASQWEEVAVTVAARCGYDEPSKSATQCRHKIEKLRKRYRAEKQKPNPCAWEFFDLMDHLERGPLPISARPMAMVQYHNSNRSGDDENSENDLFEEVNEAKYDVARKKSKSKSVNRTVGGTASKRKASMNGKLNGVGNKFSEFLQKPVISKRKERFKRYESDEQDEEEEDEEEEVGGARELVFELAAEIKTFAERLVKMENKKMEIMRETELHRMEMENKRMQMIVESQRKIVDTIGRAFGSHKKLKVAQDI